MRGLDVFILIGALLSLGSGTFVVDLVLRLFGYKTR